MAGKYTWPGEAELVVPSIDEFVEASEVEERKDRRVSNPVDNLMRQFKSSVSDIVVHDFKEEATASRFCAVARNSAAKIGGVRIRKRGTRVYLERVCDGLAG